MSDEKLEALAWWAMAIFIAGCVASCVLGFVVGYKYQVWGGTDQCKLDGVTCFDYKDTRLIRFYDWEGEANCYTLDGKTVSCVRR